MRTLCTLLASAGVALADGGADFAHDLFTRLSAREGNVAFSPLSVRMALAMVCAGARGPTAAEMEAALRCDAGTHAALSALAREYDGKEMPALANAVWVQQGAALEPAYLELLRDRYGAPAEAVDFADAGPACDRINAWVAGRTRERIRDIVNPDMLAPNTTLVLANALHFKAAWKHPFRRAITRDRPFALASGEKVAVPFMAETGQFPYAERDGAQAVELPYEGGRFSMIVVLPAPGGTGGADEGLLEALEDRSVTVYLPRFKVEAGYRLERTLEAMGMKSAFGRDADFSGINGRRDLRISLVAHKAFVAVDEEGTEAAAATVVALELKGQPGGPVVFRADRPFLFLIRDRENGCILFLGRVSDPRP
jgi:serpin B